MLFEITLLILGGLVVYLVYERNTSASFKRFKGPPPLPLVGNAFDFIKLGNVTQNTIPYLSSLVAQYGPRTDFTLGPMKFVVLSDPQDVQKVLSSSVHVDKGTLYDFITDWLGRSILTSTGERWTIQRKLLTPAFHYEILKQFLPTINEQSRILIRLLTERSKDGDYFDASKMLTDLTLDIICETAMGRKVNAQTDPNCVYGKAVHAVSPIIQERLFRPWLHPNFLWRISHLGRECFANLNIIHSFTREVINEKKEERKLKLTHNETLDNGTPGKKKAFLDLVLQLQEETLDGSLTEQDIVYEVATFMFGGHDSTAQFFSWAFLELGNNQEVQARLHEEIDSIFEGDLTRPVEFDDISRMNYLEMTIKEILRLHPILPSIMREIRTPCVLDGDAVIDKGVNAWIFIQEIHTDKNIYPDPFKFEPSRFSPQQSSKRHPYSFLPFSAGPRNCIGQKFAMLEMKTVLANILRSFVIHSENGMTDNPAVWELTSKPKNGVKVKLNKR